MLEGKVAIVTGGGGGIGRGIVERFAAEGAAVVFAEIDADRARETQVAVGERVVGVVCDVREPVDGRTRSSPRRATTSVASTSSSTTSVTSAAGAPRSTSRPTTSGTTSTSVNLAHVFACSRAVLPHMVEQGDGGSIINVSTIEAFRAIPTRAVYSAFKAAITGFTRSLAVEYAQRTASG